MSFFVFSVEAGRGLGFRVWAIRGLGFRVSGGLGSGVGMEMTLVTASGLAWCTLLEHLWSSIVRRWGILDGSCSWGILAGNWEF